MTPIKFEFEAIGTRWIIDIITPHSAAKQNEILKKIKSRIETYDKTYSRFRQDSLITAIAQNKGEYLFPEDAEKLFSFYKKMYDATEGNVTPLIGQTLSDAGYDANYSLKPKKLSKPPSWDDALSFTHPQLTVKKPVLLDFGAAGKGYMVDMIAELLIKNGFSDFCIDAGGDIKQFGINSKTIRVGLEHPKDFSKVIGVAEIQNKSICASSGNRRNWGEYNHIIDPYTLSSPKNILSTWAIASDAILADGMSTCLFFVPGEKLSKSFNFEYLILFSDFTHDKSPKFPGEVYTNKEQVKKL